MNLIIFLLKHNNTILFAQLGSAVLSGWLFNCLNIPVGWLLGPMLLGVSYAILRKNPQPLPESLAITGHTIIALATAARFSRHTLMVAVSYAPPLLLSILITVGLSWLNGYLLWRWAGIDRKTGWLGCIPGAGPSIVAMSEEMGADAVTVAVLQYLRILMVILVIPTLAGLFFPVESKGIISPSSSQTNSPILPFLDLSLLAICGLLGLWIGNRIKFPASSFLCPFLVSLLAFWFSPYPLQFPPFVFTIGLVLVGLSIGLKFHWEAARQLFTAVLIEAVLVLVLIFICLGVGYGFHLLTRVDTITSVLGITPGGMTAMIATVIQLNGDSGLVMAMQMSRMLLILLITPWLTSLSVKKYQSQTEKDERNILKK